MKDSVQNKLTYLDFDIKEKDEFMCNVFDKRHRYLLVDSDSIEELEKMFVEFEKTDEV